MARFIPSTGRVRFQPEFLPCSTKTERTIQVARQLQSPACCSLRQLQRLLNQPKRDTQIGRVRFQPSPHQPALSRQRKRQQRP